MVKTISKKIYVKSSAAKPSGKPLHGDKTFGIEPAICLYAIEYSDDTEKVEEAEILAVYKSSLVESKQNLVKMQFPYIDMFDHEVPVVIGAMRNLTVGFFEHLEIPSPMDVYKRLAYTQRILREAVL